MESAQPEASPDRVLYQPTPEQVASTQLDAFRRRVEREHGLQLADSAALHTWSVQNPGPFWRLVWEDSGVLGEPGGVDLLNPHAMPGARFFPEARLNFAENLLRRTDDGVALIYADETGTRERVTFAQLRAQVASMAAALSAAGVVQGDRVAGYVPNAPIAVRAMLAAASLGATWSSCSPDFGSAGVVDRFGQIEPRVLVTVPGYGYGGKYFDIRPKIAEVLAAVPSIERCVLAPHDLGGLGKDDALSGLGPLAEHAAAVSLADFLAGHEGAALRFTALPFDHPLYVLYSSGTTGKPKCIVHGAGGTLLQHLKEHRLHTDLRADERLFYFSTCGWMMWNWLVSGLAVGATLVLYDGNPMSPTHTALFELAERERINVFGTSAKYIDALAKQGVVPREEHDLGSVRAVLSTGSPLVPESFDYVYESIKADVLLASISGGTDIVSCFVLGDPTRPVRRGAIQAKGLGMDVQVWNDEGARVIDEQGELVCATPFPSMPVGFWGDDDGSRYRAAYFERFPGVWCHGDFTRETPDGGFVITGRSDAVLNPGGVRIGTAEIYRQVERLAEIQEAIVIGQPWDGDVRVVLFVVLAEGATLDDELRARIKREIRQNASPRHVPAKILAVAGIPRTRSGKISELSVRRVVTGQAVKNVEALANPEALEFYKDLPELSE
ncbi:MAG: acetoacetate--CoA ligase [Myxococcales bacterium]|nr:acetoacetate--CoA ligase [Myxococcales bacterium]